MAANKIICDTDVLIDYWDTSKKRHHETKAILDNDIGLDNVILSAITKMELLVGAQNKKEETQIKKNLQRFNIALINDDITNEAMRLIETYRLSHGLAIPDSIIAATAKVTGLKLFTYNIKDYTFISKLQLFVSKQL